MDKMKMESTNILSNNIEKIAELFPNCITETTDDNGKLKKAINFELLRQMLSEDIADDNEKYEFTWVGKKASIVEANRPIRKTLRPCIDESKNWNDTENLYIEGDNLEVLKLLQESYLGKVKMIYIDPPYNTGNDFIYRDDFAQKMEEYEEELGVFDDDDNRLFKNSDSNGRFHSDWCSMMYSRIMLSRNLLAEDGVLFISIDDIEYSNIKKICDEIFGSDEFIANFIWKSRQNKDNRNITGVSIDHEYILCYGKKTNFRAIKGADRKTEQYSNPDNDPRGVWTSANMAGILPADKRPNCHYDLIDPETGINYGKPKMGWRYDQNTMNRLIAEKRIIWPDNPNGRPRKKSFLSEISDTLPGYSSIVGENIYTRNATNEIDELFEGRFFSFPKPTDLISTFIEQATNKNSIIIDFFSGSATTANAVFKVNKKDEGKRKFILVQIPELINENSEAYKAGYKTICDIGKERIRRAGEKIKEENPDTSNNLDIGFRVFKLDDSNMKDVYYSADEYNQNLLDMLESNIKEDRTDLDLLFGCVLDWGIPLSLPYSSEEIDGCTVHNYNDGDLIACFNEDIPETVIKAIAKKQPLRAVFRDSGFANSPSKINVGEIFKMLAPDTRVKVI